MKKYTGFVLSVSIVLSALAFTNAQALTASDISMLQAAGIISQAQATALSASIGGSLPQAQTNSSMNENEALDNSISSCIDLKNNLSYGSRDASTNGEVTILQDFLQANNYLATNPSGFYGLMTVAAVKNFQSAYGINKTGYVGPMTRAEIHASSCKGQTTTAPTLPTAPINSEKQSLVVTYPQAGYSLENSGVKDSGRIANIQWISSGLNNAGVQGIQISLFNAKGGFVKYIAMNTANTGSYVWAYDSTLQDGEYQLKLDVFFSGKGYVTPAYSGHFMISGSPASQTVPNIILPTPTNTQVNVPVYVYPVNSTMDSAKKQIHLIWNYLYQNKNDMTTGSAVTTYDVGSRNYRFTAQNAIEGRECLVGVDGNAQRLLVGNQSQFGDVQVTLDGVTRQFESCSSNSDCILRSSEIRCVISVKQIHTATACTTQGSNTAPGGIAADDSGIIGCDIVANGTFDQSKSYCRGQSSGKQQTLIPDGYGRKNWFYTTIYGLNSKEHVDVVINSNGKDIKCSPLPAGVPEHSGYVQ